MNGLPNGCSRLGSSPVTLWLSEMNAFAIGEVESSISPTTKTIATQEMMSAWFCIINSWLKIGGFLLLDLRPIPGLIAILELYVVWTVCLRWYPLIEVPLPLLLQRKCFSTNWLSEWRKAGGCLSARKQSLCRCYYDFSCLSMWSKCYVKPDSITLRSTRAPKTPRSTVWSFVVACFYSCLFWFGGGWGGIVWIRVVFHRPPSTAGLLLWCVDLYFLRC